MMQHLPPLTRDSHEQFRLPHATFLITVASSLLDVSAS